MAARLSGSLLDTSVLVARDPDAALELPESAAISVITLGELRAGVLIARKKAVVDERIRRLAAVRAVFAPLPVEEAVADEYGRILAVARTKRRTVKASDLLIIATAAATFRRLFTLDTAQAQLAADAGIAATVL